MSVSPNILLYENRLTCRCEPHGPTRDLNVDQEVLNQWRGWAADYDRVLNNNDPGIAVKLGRALDAYLDGQDRWLARSLETALEGAIRLELRSMATAAGMRAFFDLPWELLHGPQGWFSADEIRLYQVVRRQGEPGAPWEPVHADLMTLFIAADPIGAKSLN